MNNTEYMTDCKGLPCYGVILDTPKQIIIKRERHCSRANRLGRTWNCESRPRRVGVYRSDFKDTTKRGMLLCKDLLWVRSIQSRLPGRQRRE